MLPGLARSGRHRDVSKRISENGAKYSSSGIYSNVTSNFVTVWNVTNIILVPDEWWIVIRPEVARNELRAGIEGLDPLQAKHI